MKNNIYLEEKGAVLLEAAIILPILIFVSLMGFELTRLIDLQLLKRDVTRVLALSHVCAFRQESSATNCYEQAITNALAVSNRRFLGTSVYIQNYRIAGPPSFSRNCSNPSAFSGFPIERVASSDPTTPYYSKFKIPPGATTYTIADVFFQNKFHSDIQNNIGRQLCLNGNITVVEFHLLREPIFSINLENFSLSKNSPNTSNRRQHYEVGFI